jgi:hypothetical protein
MIEQGEYGISSTPEGEYKKILGLQEIPEATEDLPEAFVLPDKLSDIFHEAKDRTAKSGRETGVVVTVDPMGDYSSDYRIGTVNRVGDPIKDFDDFRAGKQALINYHVHPENGGPFFSMRDIGFAVASNNVLMFGLGSDFGHILLAKTKELLERRPLPILFSARILKASIRMNRRIFKDFREASRNDATEAERKLQAFSGMMDNLDTFGFGVYMSEKGSSETGEIPFKRLTKDTFSQRLTPDEVVSIFHKDS